MKAQITPSGQRLNFSDSGITSSTGEVVRFVRDEANRITQIIAPDGRQVVYSYQEGTLVAARNLALGQSLRYGYDEEDRLTLVSGGSGAAIRYGSTTEVLPVRADLAGVATFTGQTTTGTFAGGGDRFTLSLRESELNSVATGVVLVGLKLTGTGLSLPTWAGLTPIASALQDHQADALFAVQSAGLNLLEMSGTGAYSLRVTIAGDLNRDGSVDGVDSGLLLGSLGARVGDANYNRGYDLNWDGKINATDAQILNSNLGFVANRAPVVTPQTLKTHVDLQTRVVLDQLATDPEGDPLFYRLVNPVNGTVSFSPDGEMAQFLPTVGYSGTASFQVMADDGFNSSVPVTVTVNVSNAALVNLEFVTRGARLQVGDSLNLQIQGDFADQEDVVLPWSYVTLRSESSTVASVGLGQVTGLSNGVSILTAERNGLQAVTVVRVGDVPAPRNQSEFNIAIAQERGLNRLCCKKNELESTCMKEVGIKQQLRRFDG